MTKDELYIAGQVLMLNFCARNEIEPPTVLRLTKEERLYHLGSCAYYRPTTVNIMVEKCAALGHVARQWSWPGYVIDRTPYGVLQHELGHHLDHLRPGLSKEVYAISREKPLTGYLGTDDNHHDEEWFAEQFRLFVTNPDLLRLVRPKTYDALISKRLVPVVTFGWQEVLADAPARTVEQARKKIAQSQQGAPARSPL